MATPPPEKPSKKNRPTTYVGQGNKALLCEFVKANFQEMMTKWNGFDGIDKMIQKIVYGGFCDRAKELGVKGLEDKTHAESMLKRWQYDARYGNTGCGVFKRGIQN